MMNSTMKKYISLAYHFSISFIDKQCNQSSRKIVTLWCTKNAMNQYKLHSLQ